jgi:hypothetical protein
MVGSRPISLTQSLLPYLACGGDLCGAFGNQNFGQPVLSSDTDPGILGGSDVRPGDWGFGVSIQREVLPRVSVEVGYNRRWLQNFRVDDDLSLSPADVDEFSLTAPEDPRLPGGGGYEVTGLYVLKPESFGGRATRSRPRPRITAARPRTTTACRSARMPVRPTA